MSEMARDVGRLIERAETLAGQAGGEIDKAYVAARAVDWGMIASVPAALFAIGAIIVVVTMCIDANREQGKPPLAHPRPGDHDYLDWANRTGKYAEQDPIAERPPGPFRW